MLPFEGSTQSRSWVFNQESLRECRKQAVASLKATPLARGKLARKFASGFHERFSKAAAAQSTSQPTCTAATPSTNPALDATDQETLIRFHAHQIQVLVGPTAILPELQRSASVLSTAVILFRRFYLSNSAAEVPPRKIAAACAFFASKLEEERVEISLLSHATALVQQRLHSSALCRQELSAVSISDIEAYETILMEGVNYQFICHHPLASIGFLAKDVSSFMFEQKHPALQLNNSETTSTNCNKGRMSPTSAWYEDEVDEHANELLHRAMQVLNRANVFSDAPFLFAPGHIAFAIVAIVVESANDDGFLGDLMQDYLVTRYPMQSEEEILSYTRHVSRVIALLLENDYMDLRPLYDHQAAPPAVAEEMVDEIVAQRAEQLHRVLCLVRKVRHANGASPPSRKRRRTPADSAFTPPRALPAPRKMVTPTY